jgi:ABC-type multidrug transport system permease subunit
MRTFFAMFKARTMEFVRDRGTFFWNLLFPIALVFGFAFAFSGDRQDAFSVGLIGPRDADLHFLSIEQIDFVEYDAPPEGPTVEEAVERVRRHQLDMLIDFESRDYYINSESNNGPILRLLFAASAADTADAAGAEYTERAVDGRPIRYVDWLVPGVIGMNMMFSCLFGVGFVIVRYRKNGVLKRLKATPVSALTFVSAQAASRLVIVVVTSIVVYTGTNAFLGFMMNGSYVTLLLLTTVTILCMIAIGLVFAARLRSEELTSGLMNVITLPMLIFSGLFFSLEGAPRVIQNVSRAFPLTHFVEGAREVMIEGAGLIDIMPNLLFLAILTVAMLLVSAALFKWE